MKPKVQTFHVITLSHGSSLTRLFALRLRVSVVVNVPIKVNYVYPSYIVSGIKIFGCLNS